MTYVTGLGTFGRESYAWVGREKGFFARRGLDVKIAAGAAGDKNLALLSSGEAQFAVIDYAGAVDRAGRGKFGDFKLVAAGNPQTLMAIIAPASKIKNPRDLEGKTVGVAHGAAPGTLFPMYAKLAGIDATGVKVVGLDKGVLISALASGQVDAIGQFVTGRPAVQAAVKGRPITVLPYGDYATDLYGNVLVTTAKLAAEDPDLVRRFTAAWLEGLAYTVEHPQEAGEILHRAEPTQNAATAAAEVEILRGYVRAEGGLPLGAFDAARVARSIAALQAAGQIPLTDVSPESFVDFQVVGGVPHQGRPAAWREAA